MSKPLIQTKKAVFIIDRLVETLEDRALAFQRYVVNQIAQHMMEELQSSADKQDPDLGAYTKEMAIAMTPGKVPAFSVLYYGEPMTPDQKTQKNLLYFVRPVTRKKDIGSPRALLFAVLNKYSPYTKETFPKDVPIDGAFIVTRRASTEECIAVKEKNTKDLKNLTRDMKKHQLDTKVRRIQSLDDAPVYDDKMWMVLRKELGLGIAKRRHWLPAIWACRDNSFLEMLSKQKQIRRTWTDIKYTGWMKLGMVKKTVSQSSLMDTKQFQDIIVKKV